MSDEAKLDESVQLDAAAHNAIYAHAKASSTASEYYGRALVAKQREIFALRDRISVLTSDNAKLLAWEERAKHFETAYNALLEQVSAAGSDRR